MSRSPALLLAVVVAVYLAGCRASAGPGPTGPRPTADPARSEYAVADPVAAPPLDLVDQNARAFHLDRFAGTPLLLYFGYTNCPDVCPATVGVVAEVTALLDRDQAAVFVTVDPERDTVAAMRDYVRHLAPGWTGLTGSAEQIRVAAEAYGVTYKRIATDGAQGYLISHSADLFLVDGEGRLTHRFPFDTPAAEIAADIRALASD